MPNKKEEDTDKLRQQLENPTPLEEFDRLTRHFNRLVSKFIAKETILNPLFYLRVGGAVAFLNEARSILENDLKEEGKRDEKTRANIKKLFNDMRTGRLFIDDDGK